MPIVLLEIQEGVTTATGGVPPYTLWSNGQTTSQVNNVSVGTYQCTITDQNGCESTGVTSVATNLSVNLIHNNITCFGSIMDLLMLVQLEEFLPTATTGLMDKLLVKLAVWVLVHTA